ncbi:hypothetical protein LJS53_003437 [Salmonella enterica]|nr:hypothetical protein [Salmonella enterica]
MMVKYSFFKNSVDKTEFLLFLIFYWLMVVMPIICIMALLVGTFDIALNNVGESVSGLVGSLSRGE